MEQDFIQNHWKGKLIKNNFDRSFTNEVKLSQETRSFLENIGLPVILPIEEKTSFLPFTCFPQKNIQDKDFYIIGDFSPDLTGSVLLGIETGDEKIYRIRKDHEHKNRCSLINESLQQFLLFLAHYNILQEEDNKRVKEGYKETATQARTEYEEFKQKLIEIDKSALPEHNTGAYWNHILFNIRVAVESIEEDEKEGPYPPLGDDEDRFLDISREDLPF